MRDFLENFDRTSEDDPVRKAQTLSRQPLPRRFYKTVAVAEHGDGFAPTLDGRPALTPGRTPLVLPTRDLADLAAAEWAAQGENIDPATMPLTRLANAAIDAVAAGIEPVRAAAARYAGSDLLFYRADSPDSLVARQTAIWDPVLAWVEDAFGARFSIVAGVMPVAQPDESIAAIAAAVPASPALLVAAFHSLTTLTGSVLLALAVLHGRLAVEEAWAAASLDEDWNMELWGSDREALQRRAYRGREAEAAARVMAAFRAA
ncbi:ATP12 family chaperone protein [Segnochrobactrum spirostomi]|uniref:ATPase n=1 Tax=Segnochrobactrum spirostomi TaxID=2608987 RepID=A0A6A7XZS6_9HYPH|nr:ATP12 family protein [Segnochrobactrum spirostomi]MQT11836.1 ATPase [Segnochrobactrum spirostomi]